MWRLAVENAAQVMAVGDESRLPRRLGRGESFGPVGGGRLESGAALATNTGEGHGCSTVTPHHDRPRYGSASKVIATSLKVRLPPGPFSILTTMPSPVVRKTRIPPSVHANISSAGKLVGTYYDGIYQFEGTLFRNAGAVVLGVSEWNAIKARDLARLEMVEGSTLLRWCDGDDAREHGAWLSTPRGKRWAIPLTYWRTDPPPP